MSFPPSLAGSAHSGFHTPSEAVSHDSGQRQAFIFHVAYSQPSDKPTILKTVPFILNLQTSADDAWALFSELLRRSFNIHPEARLAIRYFDPDGDLVVASSQAEFLCLLLDISAKKPVEFDLILLVFDAPRSDLTSTTSSFVSSPVPIQPSTPLSSATPLLPVTPPLPSRPQQPIVASNYPVIQPAPAFPPKPENASTQYTGATESNLYPSLTTEVNLPALHQPSSFLSNSNPWTSSCDIPVPRSASPAKIAPPLPLRRDEPRIMTIAGNYGQARVFEFPDGNVTGFWQNSNRPPFKGIRVGPNRFRVHFVDDKEFEVVVNPSTRILEWSNKTFWIPTRQTSSAECYYQEATGLYVDAIGRRIRVVEDVTRGLVKATIIQGLDSVGAREPQRSSSNGTPSSWENDEWDVNDDAGSIFFSGWRRAPPHIGFIVLMEQSLPESDESNTDQNSRILESSIRDPVLLHLDPENGYLYFHDSGVLVRVPEVTRVRELEKELQSVKLELNETRERIREIQQLIPVPPSSLVVHERFGCDGCGRNPIVGIRYHCTVCDNYDLCSSCEDKVHPHPMIKFRTADIPTPIGPAVVTSSTPALVLPAASSALVPPLPPRASPASQSTQSSEPIDAKAPEVPASDVPPLSSGTKFRVEFVKDISFMDGAVVGPGEAFVKKWRLRSTGVEAVPAGWHLLQVGGDTMGPNTKTEPLPAVKPGDEIDVEVNMIAPELPGRYVSIWRATLDSATGSGSNESNSRSRFGPRVWCDVTVR